MKNPEIMDLYSDYLLSSFSTATSVNLSQMLDGLISHDKISRFLGQKKLEPKDFWKLVKPLIRKIESNDAVLVIDDTIEEKPYTTENDIVCWHWDHSKDMNVKGINIVNFLYCSKTINGEEVNLPVSFQIIEKNERYYDVVSQKTKRRSATSKNEILREHLRNIVQLNRLVFKYLSWDIWFSSADNFDYVHKVLKKYFVSALKSNRTFALSMEEKRQGKFVNIDSINMESNRIYKVWLKGLDFETHLIKQVFTNEDGSNGVSYLITNDLELSFEQICTIYKKRWNVEVFHKSLKQNVLLEKSPTKYEVTQSNHIFASLIAFCKLEILKYKENMNHFQIKSRLYLCAIKAAFKELQTIKINYSTVIPIKSRPLAIT